MKKRLFVAVLLMGYGIFALAQADGQPKPRLGILPFAGGVGGVGETLASLLSSQPEIQNAFTVVPITGEAVAAVSEHLFQRAGFAFTDSDAVAAIGNMLDVDYVISGHMRLLDTGFIRRLLSGRNLVVATVICVETLELVGGYYRVHRSVWELGGFMPSMSETLAEAILGRAGSEPRPTLAVAPYRLRGVSDEPNGADARDLQALTQILAIEIARSGEYAVVSRASVMQGALNEWEVREADERAAAVGWAIEMLWGIIDVPHEVVIEEAERIGSITAMGRAAETDLVLSVEKRDLGDLGTFVAGILHTEDAVPIYGASRGYRSVCRAVDMMAEIAFLLTSSDSEDAQRRIAAFNHQRRLAGMFGDPARFWSVGASVGTSLADPWLIGTLQGTAAPFPFSFIRLGVDAGFISGMEGAGYFSLYPFAQFAFFLPFCITPIPLRGGGLYIGAGGGFLMARYAFYDLYENIRTPMADFVVGVNIGNMVDVSYSLRTNFSSFNSKISVGFTHRFFIR